MVFSTNQVRHLFVTKKDSYDPQVEVTEKSDIGDFFMYESAEEKAIYFKYKGADSVLRSDLIKIDNILDVRYIPASADSQKTTLKQVTVTLSGDVNEGNPISGQDYILRIIINPYLGISDEEPYVKYGAVHATKGMKTGKFYTKLAASLFKNFSRELAKMLEFTIAGKVVGGVKHVDSEDVLVDVDGKNITVAEDYKGGITITEVEQDWILGTKEQTSVNFTVMPTTVIYNGDEVVWGETKSEVSSTTVHNGKKIADLEYFCMGERGDHYRNVGWPNVIHTQYLVDPTQAYDILEIHYAYVGPNEGPQKSEKSLVIVAPEGNTFLADIATGLRTLMGIPQE